ncbi:hypothetical protein QR721_09950 [Aciduricibacillus chroicocephali]|uniref:Tetratricopeptide repeat protein n=1 Tax=Aciduricibacillus chroicocephali TaxID=3054939 RepID=A0ABY9KSR1_9BACI|nr:hypothetical protein QR721_09950 [Bacillaceae bacterium 44XB]
MPSVKDKPSSKQLNNLVPFIPDGDFYFTKGVEAFRKTKFQSAIKWLQRALELSPKDPLYQCQLSVVYTEIGFFHSANELLMDVLDRNRDKYPDCYYLLANNYAHLGLLNEAKKHASFYLNVEPDGDFADEAEALLELLDIDEEDDEWELDNEDELLVSQEAIFRHMEYLEWETALPLIQEMMENFPDQPLAKHDYALALFEAGEREKALELELGLLEKNEDEILSHLNLAVFYHELGDKEKSEQFTKQLLNVYPMHEQQKLRIAVVLAKTGHYEVACNRFRQLQRSGVRSHPSFYRWFSRSSYMLGDHETADRLWNEGCRKHAPLMRESKPWELSKNMDENASIQ